MKLLTIIIPVFNTKKYLSRCLKSVESDAVEIIAIDDGSIDGSSEFLDEYVSMHSNIQVIHTQNNGAAIARLIGLNKVSFVDSDDTVNIKNYLNLIKKMEFSNQKVGNGRMSVFFTKYEYSF